MNDTERTQSDQVVLEKQPVSSTEIDTLLRKLVRTHQPGDDNRKSRRHAVSISVPLIPVDAEGRPVGAPFMAMSRDISSSGINLIYTRAMTSKYLLVELRAPHMEQVKLLAEVVRCRATGRFYEIAGKFLSRFSNEPSKIAAPAEAAPAEQGGSGA